jgi:hypothetical protein
MILKFLIPFILVLLVSKPSSVIAQDSLLKKESATLLEESKKPEESKDTTINYAKIAATRSAILPGLGQIYNKKYWKLPIVYGALGTTAFVFAYNLKNYKDLKQAYIGKYNARTQQDSTEYKKINPKLLPLSEESLRFNRDQFRRNADYSVLVFAIIWGLNVLDAAVDAHLKTFDVSEDLSLKIKPGHSDMAGTNGISLVLKIGK